MRNEETKLDVRTAPVRATYSVGRKVVAENGEHVIERQDRKVVATLTLDKKGGRVFHRGARIA
jgi:hypothetical protein